MKIHSWLSKKCLVRESCVGGKGVFANADIKKTEMIALWGGKIYSASEADSLCKANPHFLTHTVSIYNGFYLGPTNLRKFDDTEFFNHSCEPNIGVKGQIILVARRKIIKGEELFFDYDTTETSEDGWFYCKCGTNSCRKKIDGSGWKNPDFVNKNWHFLSWYIKEKIKKKSVDNS